MLITLPQMILTFVIVVVTFWVILTFLVTLWELLKKYILDELAYQLREVFSPYPDSESWAYHVQTWWYDLRVGRKTTENFSINPSEEADSDEDENHCSSIDLDIPAYLRRERSISNPMANWLSDDGVQVSNERRKHRDTDKCEPKS